MIGGLLKGLAMIVLFYSTVVGAGGLIYFPFAFYHHLNSERDTYHEVITFGGVAVFAGFWWALCLHLYI